MDISNINCGDAIKSTNLGKSCITVQVADIEKVALCSEAWGAAGEYLTPAEIDAKLAANKAIIFNVAGANVPEPSLVNIPIEKSINMVEGEVLMESNSLNVNIMHINNAALKAFAENNLAATSMYMIAIDKFGRQVLGGKNGILTPSYIANWSKEFQGVPSINKTFSWVRNPYTFDYISPIDAGYLTLTNYYNVGTITTTNVIGTSKASFVANGFLNITGWDKILLPTLWAKITPDKDTLTLYNAVTMQAGEAVAVVAFDTANTVAEANSSGFGGTVELINVVATLNDTFTVNFSGEII